MRTTLLGLLGTLLLAACIKVEVESGPPVMVLAVGAANLPQCKISGRGMSLGDQTSGTFHFCMRGGWDETWIQCTGTIAAVHGKNVAVTLNTSADRPFDLQILGLAEDENAGIPEGGLKQTLHVPSGEQHYQLERLVVQTYDFSKG